MSTNPRSGMVRFEGNPTVFFVAICKRCDMAIPFDSEGDRKSWADEHGSIVFDGKTHPIEFAVDVIPDAAKTAQRKDVLIAALREKYANPAKASGSCASTHCWCPIRQGELVVHYQGKQYHAGCVDDSVYLRLASIADVMPGLFDTVAQARQRMGITLSTGTRTIKMPDVSVYEVDDSTPKKMNARERRRQRRKNKQWTK